MQMMIGRLRLPRQAVGAAEHADHVPRFVLDFRAGGRVSEERSHGAFHRGLMRARERVGRRHVR